MMPGKKNLKLITEYLNNILCEILYNYFLIFFRKNKRSYGTLLYINTKYKENGLIMRAARACLKIENKNLSNLHALMGKIFQKIIYFFLKYR